MNLNSIKTLVIPAGSGISITAIKALRQDKEIFVISADVDKLAPGLYLTHKSFLLPPFNDVSFFDEFKKLVIKEKINVIVPALDTILLTFSNKVDEYRELGVQIIISEPETIRLTRDKWATYLYLKDIIPMPRSFIDNDEHNNHYPLLIKPRDGSGSNQVYMISTQKELDFFYNYVKNPIIQEFLPGIEYTVDCIADVSGGLIACVPRQRIEIKNGITTKTLIVRNPQLEEMARTICKKIKMRGPFFFQAKEDQYGQLKLIEINARTAGTMCLRSFREGNFHSLAVKLAMGRKISLPQIEYDFYLTRYWEEIYLNKRGNRI